MRRKYRRLGFSEKDRKRLLKNHMKEIMNKENNWYHVTVVGMVEGPIKKVSCKNMKLAIKLLKP